MDVLGEHCSGRGVEVGLVLLYAGDARQEVDACVRVVAGEALREGEGGLDVSLVGDVDADLLEDEVVQGELLAQREEELELVEHLPVCMGRVRTEDSFRWRNEELAGRIFVEEVISIRSLRG